MTERERKTVREKIRETEKLKSTVARARKRKRQGKRKRESESGESGEGGQGRKRGREQSRQFREITSGSVAAASCGQLITLYNRRQSYSLIDGWLINRSGQTISI